MSQSTEVLTATVAALGALVVGVAAWVTYRLSRGNQPGHAPAGPPAAAYLPCHSLACGHMTTPHDHTAAGLVCRGCNHTVTEVPHA